MYSTHQLFMKFYKLVIILSLKLMQINELADIARCIANANLHNDQASAYLVSCLEDLQDVLSSKKHVALTVQTFGARIEKLLR